MYSQSWLDHPQWSLSSPNNIFMRDGWGRCLRGDMGRREKGKWRLFLFPLSFPSSSLLSCCNSLPWPFLLQMIRDDWGWVSSQSSHRLTHTLGKQEKCLHLRLVCYGNNRRKLPPEEWSIGGYVRELMTPITLITVNTDLLYKHQ